MQHPSAPAPQAPGTIGQTTRAIVPHVRLRDQHIERAGAEGAGPNPCVDKCERAIATQNKRGNDKAGPSARAGAVGAGLEQRVNVEIERESRSLERIGSCRRRRRRA